VGIGWIKEVMGMSPVYAIELNQVSKKYITRQGETVALEDISFHVPKGAFVSLIGPSGCGKTTVLSMIAGLFKQTSGEMTLFGNPIKGNSPRIGYMLQQDYLLSWRTIFENVTLSLELRGMKNDQTLNYARYLLNEMGLSHVMDKYPHHLSGGMRQRVALVRTLAANPDILLLDEPFSALDYQTKLKLEDLVAETLKRHDKTAILVTHDISEAIAMSDQVIVLDKNPGRIKKVIEIPDSIRNKIPFKARDDAAFAPIFQDIWKGFDNDDEIDS
jgi:NitT/TauT family transport system ATP-binding protein